MLPLYEIYPMIMNWVSNFGFASQMHDKMYHHCIERGREYHSNSHNAIAILFSRVLSSSTFSTLEYISLK